MTFRRYAAERIAVFVLLLFLAATFCYVCYHVVGQRARVFSPAAVARFDRYEHEGFGTYLWQLVRHGSLGEDFETGKSLDVPIVSQAPVTLSLAGGALLFALLVGVPLGIAWSRASTLGRFVGSPLFYLAVSAMPIWIGLYLQIYPGYEWQLLPNAGYCNFFTPNHRYGCNSPIDWANRLVLPSVALGLALSAVYALRVRNLVRLLRETAQQARKADRADAIAAARRDAAIGIMKRLAPDACWLIGTAIFVEAIFNLPGLGYGMREFLFAANSSGQEGTLLFTCLVATVLYLAIDLTGARLSSRWRET